MYSIPRCSLFFPVNTTTLHPTQFQPVIEPTGSKLGPDDRYVFGSACRSESAWWGFQNSCGHSSPVIPQAEQGQPEVDDKPPLGDRPRDRCNREASTCLRGICGAGVCFRLTGPNGSALNPAIPRTRASSRTELLNIVGDHDPRQKLYVFIAELPRHPKPNRRPMVWR
jgi:hypothetical protein